MARKIQIRPPKIENIHGVRLVITGALNLLMLAAGGLGAPLAAGRGEGLLSLFFLMLAAALGAAALAIVTPVFWKGNRKDRALAGLASIFPVLSMIMFFLSR